AALVVLDEVVAPDAKDLGVLAADRRHGDDDAAVGVAPQHEAVAVQRHEGPLVGALEDVQRCHDRPLDRRPRLVRPPGAHAAGAWSAKRGGFSSRKAAWARVTCPASTAAARSSQARSKLRPASIWIAYGWPHVLFHKSSRAGTVTGMSSTRAGSCKQ